MDDADEIVVEICAGEGGDDSKIFVGELLDMYVRYAKSLHAKAEIMEDSPGHKSIQVLGKAIGKAFKHEPGKHVVQRNPPTENKGRRHTSVVSVAVLPIPPERDYKPLPEAELEVTTMVGTGAGGQNRNKVASCVRIKHKPTGITAVMDRRVQWQNRRDALKIVTARVHEKRWAETESKYNANRKRVLSNSGRGDKVRTYNYIESRVVDHKTGKKTRNIKDVMRGNLGLIL